MSERRETCIPAFLQVETYRGVESMFEQWKEKELAAIKKEYGTARAVTIAVMAWMGLSVLTQVWMLLDGGGAFQLVLMAVEAAVMVFAWKLGDYKGRFVKPLLASIGENLPAPAEREAFAQEMADALELRCPATAQGRKYPLFLGREYLYFRRPGKSKVLKSRSIRRMKLSKETYTVGRGHVRTCYGVYLYQEEDKPVWSGVFLREEEAYEAAGQIEERIPSVVEKEDGIAYGKTEEGRREERNASLRDFILAALVVGAMVLIVKLIK